jgi:hypothetical protein
MREHSPGGYKHSCLDLNLRQYPPGGWMIDGGPDLR